MKSIYFFLLSICLTSCGYKWGSGELLQNYGTVCVPYIENDREGFFTTALIRKVTEMGALAYRNTHADLILKVCLLSPEEVNVGYVYAPPDEGDNNFSKIVVTNEARLTLSANFSLMDGRTGRCVLGPIEVKSSLTYDFEPDLSNVNFHAQSLGQLEMHNLAQDAAIVSLYSILATKIVDYVNYSW